LYIYAIYAWKSRHGLEILLLSFFLVVIASPFGRGNPCLSFFLAVIARRPSQRPTRQSSPSRGGRCPWFRWIAASLTLLAMTRRGGRQVAKGVCTELGTITIGVRLCDKPSASPFLSLRALLGVAIQMGSRASAAYASAGLPRRLHSSQ
jgi:hypothetical protein